ncbi:MAG: hypothetical protein LBP53_01345 [Candidatus Peribacteria bacterium]|nr:hypothetical protein [Candidatus Peribacteria bacterium]
MITKKICLLLSAFSCCFLMACASQQPTLSLAEMETIYENSLQTTILTPFLFTPAPLENEALQTQTDLSVHFSSSQKLQGNLTYASNTQGEKERATLQFNGQLQDTNNPIPFSASGTIDTLYTDPAFYFKIQDFHLFMGEGNAEVNFINLLAQQLAHKWISLEESERFGISVVKTPDISTILQHIITLFSAQKLQTEVSTSLPLHKISGRITTLDNSYIANAQTLYATLAQLAGIPLETEHLQLDTSATGNAITYTARKHQQVAYTTSIHYRSTTHTFATTLSFTPEEIKLMIFNIRPVNIVQGSDEDISLVISLKPRTAQRYVLNATLSRTGQPQQTLESELTFLPSEDRLEINVQGIARLNAFPLLHTQPFSLTFQLKETLQTSSFADFTLTGDVVRLSELL